MYIDVSVGEFVDKISILQIKNIKILDQDKIKNIQRELVELLEIVPEEIINDALYFELSKINIRLWHIEDDIREKERLSEFDDEFIQLARDVYITNDLRAKIKKQINIKYGSDIIEEKSYNQY